MQIEEKIKTFGQKKEFKKNEYLFSKGDAAQYFYYILQGEVRIFKLDADGNELEINRFSQGDFLGEIILFASKEYPVYAEAVTIVKVLKYSKETVLKAIADEKGVAEYFLHLFAKKCLMLNKKLEDFSLKTVRQRLIQYVFSLCKGDGKCMISLPLKKTELAKKLGTISATLSRTLKKLQEEKLITVKGNVIFVRNCAVLREEVNV